ncbi:hypothetical protein [Hymenobacter sp. HDW8]|uniref:hypothetical protein n=1 Tax=Hymenobacter sp. HDW8 TaxID=2714932 RepID=UPI0014087D5D|nr:hypothetical protein [Hymenobacter sp. HDW8]QIL74917.1 hypothetical protein G7064_02865 [Hymenobacter sp. HDW8]
MTNLTVLLLCLGVGAVLRRWSLVPSNAPAVLNQLLVMVFMPALTFMHLAVARLDSHFLLPVLAPWLIFGAAFVFFELMGRRMRLSRATIGALILTGALAVLRLLAFRFLSCYMGAKGWSWAL